MRYTLDYIGSALVEASQSNAYQATSLVEVVELDVAVGLRAAFLLRVIWLPRG
jgi:hypothetical protein